MKYVGWKNPGDGLKKHVGWHVWQEAETPKTLNPAQKCLFSKVKIKFSKSIESSETPFTFVSCLSGMQAL
jgi:hypothetical protein